MTSKPRKISGIIHATQTSDGAGVRLKRSLGTPQLDYLDPFLLLDEFKSDDRSDYIAGFPDHPHRGFETVTYMLAGSMEHKDHKGNQGTLVSGSVQWMTAGKGIIHSEMPKQKDGLMWGFQLWVNLPAADKMLEPRYQEFTPEEIPVVSDDDGTVIRVVAGESSGIVGAVKGIATEPLYLDVTLPPGKRMEQPVTEGHNVFAYVFEGEGELGEAGEETGQSVGSGQMALFSDGDHIVAVARDVPFRFLLLAARPLNEPMARYGPFVMNNEDEIRQAFRDYREGRL
jgi:redox-sensitive bicupin YhaK (pirin superfamily)